MNTKKRPGRPKSGREIKKTRSIRIRPSELQLIEDRWGSLQKWFDFRLEQELGGTYEVIVERQEKEE